MLFYKYLYTHNGEMVEEHDNGGTDYKFQKSLKSEANKCAQYCIELDKIEFYILNKTEEYISFLCVFNGDLNELHNLDKFADELILKLNLDMVIAKRIELPAYGFLSYLNIAEENGFIADVKNVKEQLDLHFTRGMWFRERRFFDKEFSKDEMLARCDEVVVDSELKREVERIYQKSQDNTFGVPVHYFVNASNSEQSQKIVNILLNSLKANNRSIRNYYSQIDLTAKDNFFRIRSAEVNRVFEINMGGVVVINSYFNIPDDDTFSDENMISEMFAEQVYRHAKDVTSIICCKHKSQEKVFKQNLRDLLLVEINDTTIANSQAKAFLKNYAEKSNTKRIDGLLEMVDENIGYKVDDLIKIFNKWHKGYVKNIQYPQYANICEQALMDDNKKKEFAINSLNKMVGLESIKQTIDNFINYAKLQKACAENGNLAKNTCKHMCFVGNPGTAKTTVARYVAQVMKEKGLLKHGNLIEVGRGDIVSRYVGGTAPNVQELFKRAVGSVLFIDEAYSLYDGKDGMYGDEAINAIVQEMENRREDVVVIFAGYKNEMERFINKNSGLKSRIASIIEFPDYTEEELVKIANVQAESMDIDISQCEEKIKEIITLAKTNEKNFGNGRFVRNILEKARMQQASRLVKEDKMFGENLRILKPDDFEKPTYKQKISMGFC